MNAPALELRYDGTNTKRGLPACILVATLGFSMLASPDGMNGFVGAIFLAVGIYGTIDYYKRHRDGSSVVVRIGPEGILDRRLSRHLIYWHDIIALDERQTWGKHPRPYLDLHLKKTARITASWQLIFWRIAGARGVPLAPEGLEGTFNQIFRAAKYYADQRGVPVYVQGRAQAVGPF